ncbi:hypothetical protein CEUSTIGMA_g6827.t1 [Chlamydomonas eustigma]|uniref:Fungal lipase-type domain-containing protein n=1 Tax=Chlamydomonas eustigma TaxID=1157962 RepID=A0A250X8J2_9CHLO|nr:hypothetical protein CEUSTIGMA_g6827.t1 [Chlamydomonas eustigma]|eukprot:GAX79385.1 hypothetical protein CEUSTIGMA_g6827.t1 [Chlamydomonas eustigma]
MSETWANGHKDVAFLEDLTIISQGEALQILTETCQQACLQPSSQTQSRNAASSHSVSEDSGFNGWWDQDQDKKGYNNARSSSGALLGTSFHDSWIEIAKVVWSSLRASVEHIKALSLESIAFGYLALAKKHSDQEDSFTRGYDLCDSIAERPRLKSWLKLIDWCSALYDAPQSENLIAAALGVQQQCVLRYQPKSVPLCPAYVMVVDHSNTTLYFMIRGTSQLHDLVADVCGHCATFFSGHVHYGMLQVAMNILSLELEHIAAACRSNPGYIVHLVGHSLGGGVAALMCYIMRNSLVMKGKLGHALITATTFGCPPVMTLGLALECRSYITSVVYQDDMVARLCVHTIQALALEMDASKEEVFAANSFLTLAKSVGAAEVASSAVTAVLKYYAIKSATSLVAAQNPVLQAALVAGASWLGKAMSCDRSKQHTERSQTAAQPSTEEYVDTQPRGGISRLSSPASGVSATQSSAPFNTEKAAQSMSQAAAGAASFIGSSLMSWGNNAVQKASTMQNGSAGPSQYQTGFRATNSSSRGDLTFDDLLHTEVEAGCPRTTATAPSCDAPGSKGVLTEQLRTSTRLAAGTAATLLGSALLSWGRGIKKLSSGPPSQQSPRRPVSNSTSQSNQDGTTYCPDSAAFLTPGTMMNPLCNRSPTAAPPVQCGGCEDSASPSSGGAGRDCEAGLVSEQQNPLYNAGRLYHIQRTGNSERDARFCVMMCLGEERFQRILIKRSMLKDHFLKSYGYALLRAMEQAAWDDK